MKCKDCKTAKTHRNLPRCFDCNKTFRSEKGYDLRKNRNKKKDENDNAFGPGILGQALIDKLKEVVKESTPQPPTKSSSQYNAERYYYNHSDDVYVVFLKGKSKHLIVKGEQIREMKKQYSAISPGGYETINQICVSWSLSRKDFIKIRDAFNWTHTDDPYTDEEMLDNDPAQLAEDLVAARRNDFERQFRKQDWKQVEKDAGLWRELSYSLGMQAKDIKSVQEKLKTINSVKTYIGNINVDKCDINASTVKADNERVLIIPVGDIHVGKVFSSERHQEINIDVLEQRKNKIISIIKNNKQKVDRIVYLSLGDTFEALLGNMREGQGNNMDAHGYKQYKIGLEFHVSILELIVSEYGDIPIDAWFTPGNHDRVTKDKFLNSEDMINEILVDRIKSEFKTQKNMSIRSSAWTQNIDINKDVELVTMHGHQSKLNSADKDLASFVFIHGNKDKKQHLIIRGHYHNYQAKAIDGITYVTAPSVCGPDDYSIHNLNVKAPAQMIMSLVDGKDTIIIGPYNLD